MLIAKELNYSFNGFKVLDKLNFTIEKNQFVSFVGPSGCGKTTLMNIISGLLEVKETDLKIETANISFVFQHDTLLPWRNALKNVLLPLELKGIVVNEEIKQQALAILEQVGLKRYEFYYPRELSGGMKKRVEIARALITKPELLILDEPFSALDIITRERLNLLVKDLKLKTKNTIILVTHSVEEACFLSDKIFVLSAAPSRIISEHHVKREKNSQATQFILSDEEINIERIIRDKAKLLWNSDNNQVETKQKSDKIKKSSIFFKLLIPLELLIILGILSLLKFFLNIPDYIFPYPQAIIARWLQSIFDKAVLYHVFVTIFESLSGFIIAFFITLVVGYLIAKFKYLNQAIMPFLVAFNTLPSVALAPFLVLWFGFGYTPKIIVSVIVIFFPMLINNISAIQLAGEQMKTLIKFYKPGKITTFANFELPASLPIIFSGVKVSITLSVIGAVVGEFVSGASGLGALVVAAKANFDTELMFVALIWLIILGLAYYNLAGLLYFLINKLIKH